MLENDVIYCWVKLLNVLKIYGIGVYIIQGMYLYAHLLLIAVVLFFGCLLMAALKDRKVD